MAKSKFDRAAVRREIQEQVAKILNKKRIKTKPEDVVEGVSLTGDLGIDSLDTLQLLADLEKKHGIKIPEAELRRIGDLGDILKALEKHWPEHA